MTRGSESKPAPERPATSGESINPARAWRAPTRRMFVAMIGAAAAALAVRHETVEPERPRSTWAGKTRWIGHC